MNNTKNILVIDSGTTALKVELYDSFFNRLTSEKRDTIVLAEKPGWASIDANKLYSDTIDCLDAIGKEYSDTSVTIGITNQRETIVCWDVTTAEPLCKAIVWHDLRTDEVVQRITNKEKVKDITGLTVSTYFSAVKIQWILENEPEVLKLIDSGRKKDIRFGTVDTWLLFVSK